MQYRVVKLDDQTWRIEEGEGPRSVYLYLLAGRNRAILLDTGFGTLNVAGITARLTPLPVTVLNTHAHFDHIGANHQFARVFLHPDDAVLYDLHSRKVPPPGSASREGLPPLQWMTDGMTFDLGGRTLRVIHTPGHSLGSVCILDVERRWLFTGDTCCKADVLLCLENCATVAGYAAAIRTLQRWRGAFSLTWPSHHAVPVEPEILDQFSQAAQLLLAGAAGTPVDTAFGPCLRFAHGDVAIVYTPAALTPVKKT